MRILIIVDCYLPVTKSAAKLVHDLSAEFAKLGHEITVLAPSETITESLQISQEDGTRVVRIKSGRLKSVPRPIRGLREARMPGNIWRKAKSFFRMHPHDLIIFYSPSIFFGSLVQRLKNLWNCSSYLVLRDIYPQFMIDTGALTKGLIYSYFRRKELEQNRAADVIGVQSPGDLDYFATHWTQENFRVEVLHNWANLDVADIPTTNYRRREGLEDKVVFFYGGNFGIAQDLDNIVRLAAAVSEYQQIFFLLVGEGTEVEHLRAAISTRNLKNIRLLPPVDQQEYLGMVAEFDIGLITLDRRFKIQNIPGKLMSYLYHSKPVLASVNPGNDLLKIINVHQAGFCLENGDDQALKDAAIKLAQSSELRKKFGAQGRFLLESTFSSGAAARQVLKSSRPQNELLGLD